MSVTGVAVAAFVGGMVVMELCHSLSRWFGIRPLFRVLERVFGLDRMAAGVWSRIMSADKLFADVVDKGCGRPVCLSRSPEHLCDRCIEVLAQSVHDERMRRANARAAQ